MGILSRTQKTDDEVLAENTRLVGADIAAALPKRTKPWWREPHLLRLNLLCFLCCMSAATVGYDGAMMNALQINPNWKVYYHYPAKAKLGAINAMMPAGKILGFLFVAPFANRFGRKKALVLAFALTVVGAAIQAASVNLGLLVFSRLFLGFGCGVMSQPSPILLSELAYPTHRGKITALYHCFYVICWSNGAAWITFGTLRMTGAWSWRAPTLLQGAAPLGQLIFSWWLPESPRYLVAKGRDEEARALLVKHHGAGDWESALVKHEMIQVRDAVRTENNNERRPSLKRMMATPSNRRRLLICAITGTAGQWAGNTVVSYYLTLVLDGIGITNATHQSLINGGLQIFNLLATVGCGAMLVDVLGRRRLFQWSAVGMTASYVIWTILNSRFAETGSASFGYAVIPLLFIFYFHYDIALTPLLYSYPTELFPYEWRSWGVAFTLIVTNLTLIVGQVANPVAMAKLGWKYYILFCVLNALFCVAVWTLFPETKGKSLEELTDLLDRLDNKGIGVEVMNTRSDDGSLEKPEKGGASEHVIVAR